MWWDSVNLLLFADLSETTGNKDIKTDEEFSLFYSSHTDQRLKTALNSAEKTNDWLERCMAILCFKWGKRNGKETVSNKLR